jgi:hypothetical protein
LHGITANLYKDNSKNDAEGKRPME